MQPAQSAQPSLPLALCPAFNHAFTKRSGLSSQIYCTLKRLIDEPQSFVRAFSRSLGVPALA